MPIPDYEQVKLPALEFLSDGQPRRLREIYDEVGENFGLTPDERAELLPSGSQLRWNNRVNWACYDLYKAGILDRPKRGHYQISDFGRKILAQKPANLDRTFLRQFPHFLEWDKGSTKTGGTKPTPVEHERATSQTANERLESAFEEMQVALKQDLLDLVRKMDPYAFEQVLHVLLWVSGEGKRGARSSLPQKNRIRAR